MGLANRTSLFGEMTYLRSLSEPSSYVPLCHVQDANGPIPCSNQTYCVLPDCSETKRNAFDGMFSKPT